MAPAERRYPSDLTDTEWAATRPLLPEPGWLRGRGGRPEGYCHRVMFDVVRCLVDIGIKWRRCRQTSRRGGRCPPPPRPHLGWWRLHRQPGRILPARARPGVGDPNAATTAVASSAHHQRRGDGLLVDDRAHDPPPGPLMPRASVKRPGASSASQPHATRRFAFDRRASTRAGTTSIPNSAAISSQVSGPCPSRDRSPSVVRMRW
ncbi:transposase [Streptomyces antimycoticus]